MDSMRRWITYDWFKLFVALILLIYFILLLGHGLPGVAGPANTPVLALVTQTAPPTQPPPEPTATALPVVEVTQPLPTQARTATSLPQPTPAPTQAPIATPQPEQPTPTVEPPVETAAPTAVQSAALTSSGDCSKALPSRLDVGTKAKVVTNLYFRKEPGMDKAILWTNLPGTQLEIIGGPVCIPYGQGVYRWWNVKNANGDVGWSAEGSLLGKSYFLDPV